MEMIERFIKDAKKLNGRIIFAEGDEERTLDAAVRLARDGVCKCAVVASDSKLITEAAKKKSLDISWVEVITPDTALLDAEVLKAFAAHYIKKGRSEAEAAALALEPLNFSALYVKSGKADGCVAGARSSTADVLRAAIYGIGTAEGTKIISSFFIMVPPQGHALAKKPLIFADCAVNPDPAPLGLKDIAVSSVRSFKSLFPDEKPVVAFLSFSTKGSAEHKIISKVREAAGLTKEYFKNDADVIVDGELQFDAAFIPAVGAKKAPGSPAAGKANIYIFPDLNAGNIGYKITERLGGFSAIGPVIQGLEKPMNDLSRGCSVDDIYYVAVIALLKSR
ncbi:MAG TPA: phosphate acetyltransferase [Elusimicrobia bacterium]|nr:MAG: phosphate acetyltransferase [Elusimicrobia bacterium RIFOXYA12_FULL_49_49]OGS11162.1 MAG: phosphate acetyltransferase [Elusimicrobia bacterium RIFOXYB1_FULL_48_9]OGS14954.1 MAG: phosphate acetyltransferase [Elusimicrobia bacterium RIFOXYA2_FULL_47_53]OGS26111.1 MAG: phosphate acetyltransferase [Elusimicrobia bacterium RIFOXYB12_FULL_50_12]OGS29299.1 MAG: phosphate acetyltransferase [Elusimicrobia bacterium RIFOXYB2_FULL_46_23]HBU70349.1 phosphate acetyltransferase [Elusimicrobiota bact